MLFTSVRAKVEEALMKGLESSWHLELFRSTKR